MNEDILSIGRSIILSRNPIASYRESLKRIRSYELEDYHRLLHYLLKNNGIAKNVIEAVMESVGDELYDQYQDQIELLETLKEIVEDEINDKYSRHDRHKEKVNPSHIEWIGSNGNVRLTNLFDGLVEEGYVDSKTERRHFKAIFNGRIEKKINWLKSRTSLVLFFRILNDNELVSLRSHRSKDLTNCFLYRKTPINNETLQGYWDDYESNSPDSRKIKKIVKIKTGIIDV